MPTEKSSKTSKFKINKYLKAKNPKKKEENKPDQLLGETSAEGSVYVFPTVDISNYGNGTKTDYKNFREDKDNKAGDNFRYCTSNTEATVDDKCKGSKRGSWSIRNRLKTVHFQKSNKHKKESSDGKEVTHEMIEISRSVGRKKIQPNLKEHADKNRRKENNHLPSDIHTETSEAAANTEAERKPKKKLPKLKLKKLKITKFKIFGKNKNKLPNENKVTGENLTASTPDINYANCYENAEPCNNSMEDLNSDKVPNSKEDISNEKQSETSKLNKFFPTNYNKKSKDKTKQCTKNKNKPENSGVTARKNSNISITENAKEGQSNTDTQIFADERVTNVSDGSPDLKHGVNDHNKTKKPKMWTKIIKTKHSKTKKLKKFEEKKKIQNEEIVVAEESDIACITSDSNTSRTINAESANSDKEMNDNELRKTYADEEPQTEPCIRNDSKVEKRRSSKCLKCSCLKCC